MSLTMKALTRILHLRANNLRSVDAIVDRTKARKPDAPVPDRLAAECTVGRSDVAGMPVLTLTPKERATGTQLLYVHGGAYVNSLVPPHWRIIKQLISRTGATVAVASYPLAPEHTASYAFPKVRALYEQLQASGKPVVIAGDSAGAGLAASLTIQLRDAGATLPAALLLFSPWLDVTMTNQDIAALEPKDPMLAAAGLVWCGRQWAGDLSTTDPRISPVYDALTDLPPTYIYQGGHDVFLPDAKRFTTKANAAGTPTQLRVYPDAFHVFVGAPFTPEARRVLAHAARVITDVTG